MTTPDISDLPSDKFDKELDKELDKEEQTGDYSNYCNSISTDLPERQKITAICKNLVKNITYLKDDNKINSSFFDKHCYDLNYWLYKKVYSVLSNGEIKNRINFVLEELHKQWKNVNQGKETGENSKTCMPESKHFKTRLFEHFKQLLDYFENYQIFDEEINKPSKQSHKYCPYILQRVSLYFTIKELCSKINIDICEKYVKNYNDYNPSKLLAKLSCVVGDTYEVQLDESLVREMIYTYQSDFSKLFPNLGLSNLDLSGFNFPGFGLPNFGLSGLNFPLNLQSMFMNNIVNLVQNGFDGTGIKALFNKIPYLSDIYNYDIIQKYVMPALYGLGGLIFFFVLYKCRGCLPCCCIFRRRKKKRKHLSDFDTSGLMSATLGFPSPMMPINPYGLRYQPF